MNKTVLITQLKEAPDTVVFEDVLATIDENYEYEPVAFSNGGLLNEAGDKDIPCKIFAFGHINNLSKEQTLSCFGKYYYKDVLSTPNGEDHLNIRQFMEYGWNGLKFFGKPLAEKV